MIPSFQRQTRQALMYNITPKKCAYEPEDLRPWHHQIVDFFLQNPGATQEQCAAYFNKNPNWVSRIMGSSAFRKYYAERRKQLDEAVGETTTGRLEALTQKAIELLSKHLESSEVEPAFVLEVFDKGLQKLGYGTKSPLVVNNVQNNRHVHIGLGEILERIEDRPVVVVEEAGSDQQAWRSLVESQDEDGGEGL